MPPVSDALGGAIVRAWGCEAHVAAIGACTGIRSRGSGEQVSTLRKHHQEELLAQIGAAEERRRAARQVQLEEGRRAREAAAAHSRRVEAIKQRKLAELREAGVPEKYCAELAKYKVPRATA
jgi:Trichohyalin-plectin-homology domain